MALFEKKVVAKNVAEAAATPLMYTPPPLPYNSVFIQDGLNIQISARKQTVY